jgi:hypothetical protein
MLHALDHPIRVFDLDDGFTMVVGADPAGRVLEVESSRVTTPWWSSTPCRHARSS